MGKENVFPLRKEKGEWKTIKKRFEKMKAKKWWKKDERKNGRIQRVKNTKKVVFVKNNEVIKMEDSQKKKQKHREWKEEEKKNTMKQKKGKIHRKPRSKKRYSFKRRRMKKIGETRIEYKRDVKHIISKTFLKIKVFFFLRERIAEKMMRRFKNEGFLWFKKLKNTKLEMQKATTKVQKKKKKKSKTLALRRKEKWNKKRHVF